MSELFESIKAALSSLSINQLVAIFIAAIAISLGVKMLKEGLSTLFTVIGILAALYFFAPDLYYHACDFLIQLWHSITSMLLTVF
ncbi:hypothetical protein [Flavonifractor sp. An306]|uniref:hypothetical protein n=1 Tax=Flavonifractor sp. An306 TaxID=1965629 RepID=UPI0017483D94|nr:hypothetical protein [Flavonifractor sp. An306]